MDELEALVRKLTAKSKTSSRNSSKPPSSDSPWSKAARQRKGAGKRKPGGQPGHAKAERELRPPEEVDCVIDVRPEACRGCAGELHGSDSDPLRHQVAEIPPVKLLVTETRLHALVCKGCGVTTRAKLPPGTPKGAFGPRLEATAALLTGYHRLSRRSAQELLNDLFGLSISLGAISNIEGRVGEWLAPAHAEALERIQAAEFKHADETSWKQGGEKGWLWVAKSREATAFLIRDNRGGDVARELLNENFTGTLISDRWSGYSWIDLDQRQVCWAHLFRDFRKMAESGGKRSKKIGEDLELLGGAVFDYLYKFRGGMIPREEWLVRADDFRKDIRELLEQGAALDEWRAPGLCRGILKVEPAMWTFLRTEGIEPTNNDGERAIRRAVIWRKTSFGTQSDRGSRYAERMLTCAATLRMHGRNVIEYLHQVCAAALTGSVPKSLFE